MQNMPFHGFGLLKLLKINSKQWSTINIWRRHIFQSYYEILKLPESCTSKEIREAFILLSKENHPDRHINDQSMHTRFIKISEAYTVLINPSKRRSYDLSLYKKRKASHFYVKVDYNQNSAVFRNPSLWENRDKSEDAKYSDKPYYGIPGIKKVSNAVALMVVIFFTLCGVGLQFLAMRSSFQHTQKRMLEQTQKNNAIHTLAQEKAKLYDNVFIAETLLKVKSKLKPFMDTNNKKEAPSSESPPQSEPSVPASLSDTSINNDSLHPRCKKCKKILKV